MRLQRRQVLFYFVFKVFFLSAATAATTTTLALPPSVVKASDRPVANGTSLIGSPATAARSLFNGPSDVTDTHPACKRPCFFSLSPNGAAAAAADRTKRRRQSCLSLYLVW